MHPIPLTETEQAQVCPGELTLATVTLVFAVVILAIIAFKFFTSPSGKFSTPSGYKFEWSSK